MCGRYTQTKGPYDIRLQLNIDDFLREITPRYNIAPGQQAPVIVNDGRIAIRLMQWGLVPSWAKDLAIGNKMINASELMEGDEVSALVNSPVNDLPLCIAEVG